MKSINLIILILLTLSLSSCANYINQMHKEFDKADGVQTTPKNTAANKFDLYRRQKAMQQQQGINSASQPYVSPSVKRQYSTSTNVNKRYKASDLVDNQNTGSLWANPQSENTYLFVDNDRKSNGDIILIQVAGKMKNEITAELKRAFPSPTKAPGAEGASAQAAGPAPAAAAPNADDEEVDATQGHIYDKISSVVIEEVNKDHLLLRGRKNVLYKNRKRVIEVQALISRRDIASDDTINSNKVIETNISVIR